MGDSDWHFYPFSIQIRSGIRHYNNKELINCADKKGKGDPCPPFFVVPTTLDIDMLYVNDFCAKNLETYPRIGLSLCFPYALKKEWRHFRFPKVYGFSAYVEFYQSNPLASTWGNRVTFGVVRGSILQKMGSKPQNIFLGTEEMTYHWQFSRYFQMNFGFGLLLAWWVPNTQHYPKIKATLNTKSIRLKLEEDNRIKLVFAPTIGIGMRYIVNPDPFLRKDIPPINDKKRQGSRVDCSISYSSKCHILEKKYYPIFRTSSSLSFSINHINAMVCTLELGYNLHKKAILADTTVPGGMEFIPFLGHEIRYGRFLSQLQIGCHFINVKKPAPRSSYLDDDYAETSSEFSKFIEDRGVFSVHLQCMLTKSFFVGITFRYKEIPGIRLGISI